MARIEKTVEELAELRKLYEEGATVEEISLDLNCSANLARRFLLDAGTTMRKPGQRVNQKTREDRNERRRNQSNRYLDPTAKIAKGSVTRLFR